MRYGILGSLAVWDGDREVSLGGPKQRALLGLLLLHANELMPTARIVDELWDEQPPATAVKTVQVYVSQLRKALGEKAIETRAGGYLVRIDPGALDADRFEDLLERGRRLLAEDAAEEAAGVLREALGLWRGPALADFQYDSFARDAIARLEELRVIALEQRLTSDLALGRHAEAVTELERVVREHPLREGPRRLAMLALYRSGRQADALAAYQDARRVLVDELGLEPSQALQQLEKAILVQDPTLELPAPAAPAVVRPQLASTLAAACPRCGRTNTPDARFCQSCGATLGHEPPAETRKTVSLVFCDLAASGEGDPESLRAVQLRSFELAATAFERHGGTVDRFTGDELMAVFGVPFVREDDALRAVRAAAELAPELQARIGVSTGEVVVGDATAGHGFVTGEAVTVARRLAQSATAGEAILAEETLALVDHAVDGKRNADGAFTLDSVKKGAPAFPRRDRTPLVNREQELARLEALYDDVAAGRGARLVTIIGDAGIGKSRLVRELLARIGDRANVHLGSCPPYGEGITYAPLRLLLPDGELEHSSHEVFAATRRVLEELARDRPVVAAFEDVHWAEPTFLDLVEQLAGRLGDARVLLLCLARHDLADRRPGWLRDAVMVEPLSREDSERLVDELGVRSEVRTQVAEAAEGNPLFAEQLASIADTSAALPASIRGVLWERIDRISRDERAILERAAVIGRAFTLSAVVDLSPPGLGERAETYLLELVRKGLVRPDQLSPDEGFRFQHALLRDAAYESMPKTTRATLHERCAERLDRGGANEALVGYHLEQAVRYYDELGRAGEGRDELAARAGRQLGFAGGRALGRGDVQAAASLLERAVALLAAEDPARPSLLTELGSVQIRAGKFAGRRGDAWARGGGGGAPRRPARRIAGRTRAAVPGVVHGTGGGSRCRRRGTFDAGARSGRRPPRAREGVVAAERGGRARLPVERPRDGARAGTHPCQACGGRARRGRNDHGSACTSALLRPDACRRGDWRCEELLRGAGGDRPLRAALTSTLAGLYAMRGDLELGRSSFADAVAVYDELGLRFRRAARAHIGAQIALLADEPAEAERELRTALDTLAEIGARGVHTTLGAVLADIWSELGRDDEAEELAREVAGAVAQDDLAPQVLWRVALARVLAHRGEATDAEALIAEALDLTAAIDFPDLRARALMAAAEVTGDAQLLDQARDVYEAKGNTAAAARVGTLRSGAGLVARPPAE